MLVGERKRANLNADGGSERSRSVARLETEPENPADAQDDEVQRQVDGILEQHAQNEPEIRTAGKRKKKKRQNS